jgi:ADP-dependent NAD(P)H-hydrate dehydratase
MSAPHRVTERPELPRRPADSHKGLFGQVLVVGGSRGMAGAAALAGRSALRSGAGLLRVATPGEVQLAVSLFEPSYMTFPLATTPDGVASDEPNRPVLEDLAASANVLAIGPGLGHRPEVASLVRWLLQNIAKPIVLDADGLNAVVGHLDALADRQAPLVLTPHPGECGRLLGCPTADVQREREAAALALSSRTGATVVLKGHGTIVTDGRSHYVNTTGNPGMATGGSGDVLTGVIAALLAQGLAPFAAAQVGTYVHGLAGDLVRDDNGEIGLIASDLVDALPRAFVAYQKGAPAG